MTVERWEEIKRVFQAALDVEESGRAAFVDRLCSSDIELRREVLRLLKHHQEAIPEDLTGFTISHYKVIEKIGEGGMGIVYKAQDTRLERIVALKFLRPEVLGNEELRIRFLQEARAAAALDHPSICTVHEIDEANGQTFLAMVYVQGERLSDMIRRRPLPLEEALNIGIQVAEGLHAAHLRGIVHRDIKSANIMVGDQGQVRIMDFGLAQLTTETRITETGIILGTPGYMSPEQIRGQPTDGRTDIWSLGVVLYEMVTGQLPFRGETAGAVALAIEAEDLEVITALRADVPADLDFIVAKALARDRAERYQQVLELLVDLKSLKRKHAEGRWRIPSRRDAKVRLKRTWRLPWAAAAIFAAALAGVAFSNLRQTPAATADNASRRFTLHPTAPIRSEWWGRSLAVSPNGRHIAMVSEGSGGKLWIQDFSRWEPRPVDGTEGASAPFWSPDSRFIAYAAGNQLMRVGVDGGAASRVCTLPNSWFFGGTWSPDGESIVFASDELFEVPASGGVAKPLELPDESIKRKYTPWFLPSRTAERVLVFSGGRSNGNLYLYDVGNRQLKLLGRGCKPSWSATGHLLYQPDEFIYELWALPFSLESMQATGKPFVIAQKAYESSVASDGTLVYLEPQGFGKGRFTWLDRKGKEYRNVPLEGVSNQYGFSLSPDGKLVAFLGQANAGAELSVWLHDFLRNRSFRLTSDPGRELVPVWSPSGEYVAYSSNRTGTFHIYVRRVDGSGESTALTTSGNNVATDWSRDGRYLFYEETITDQFGDLWYLERSRDGANWVAKPWLQTRHGERFGRFSPDGRFAAYLSNESGKEELYVRPFPAGERRWRLSTGGAFKAFWRSDGRELFYTAQGTVMAVPVTTNPDFSIGTPTRLFAQPGMFDVSADGQRFLASPHEAHAQHSVIRVVQNWHTEFRHP